MELTTSSKVCTDIISCGVVVKYRSAECVLLRFGILERGGGGKTWVVLSHVRYSRKISLVAFLRRILKQPYDRNDSNIERMALSSNLLLSFFPGSSFEFTLEVFFRSAQKEICLPSFIRIFALNPNSSLVCYYFSPEGIR